MTNDPKKQELDLTENEIDEILHRVDSLPVLNPRPKDEFLNYDEHGLPH